MPRIRSIKPDFFKSEDVSALPLRARLTWIGLWTHCDDHGRYKDSARLIKGDIWSLDDVSLRDIDEDLAGLEAERRIARYEVDGKRFLAIVNWHAHQAINRPSKPRYPGPPVPLGSADPDDDNHCDVCAKPGPVDHSPTPHGGLSEPSRQEGKGKEGKGGDARASARRTPHALRDPTSEPPSPRCPKHINTNKPPPCGPCADARKARADWDAQRAQATAAAPRCPRHRGQLAHNCAPCRSEDLAEGDS